MTTEIKYNNEVLANLEAGKMATIPCTDKKMQGDIVITTPSESGGEVDKYNITYDITTEMETIFAQPTEICDGQTVHFVFASKSSSISASATNCDYAIVDHVDYTANNASEMKYSYPRVLSLSNPMGDIVVNIHISHSGGGSN